MRWKRTRSVLKWALTIVSVFFVILIPLTRWLIGGGVGPSPTPTFSAGIGPDSIVVNLFKDPVTLEATGPNFWWRARTGEWTFWFHTYSDARVNQFVVPLWPLAVIPGIGAGLLWRLEIPERRRRLGLCVKCAYDRSGIDAGAACPECGKSA